MEFEPIIYNLVWGLYKDYSCQVWFKLTQWFLRRLKCKKLTPDEGHQVVEKAHPVELKKKREKKDKTTPNLN